jgi:hypothetical protein
MTGITALIGFVAFLSLIGYMALSFTKKLIGWR